MFIGAFTWPPEKPTATMPSSLPADKNFGEIVEGRVIIVVFKVVRAWNDACSKASWAGQLTFEEEKHPYACNERKKEREGTEK